MLLRINLIYRQHELSVAVHRHDSADHEALTVVRAEHTLVWVHRARYQLYRRVLHHFTGLVDGGRWAVHDAAPSTAAERLQIFREHQQVLLASLAPYCVLFGHWEWSSLLCRQPDLSR